MKRGVYLAFLLIIALAVSISLTDTHIFTSTDTSETTFVETINALSLSPEPGQEDRCSLSKDPAWRAVLGICKNDPFLERAVKEFETACEKNKNCKRPRLLLQQQCSDQIPKSLTGAFCCNSNDIVLCIDRLKPPIQFNEDGSVRDPGQLCAALAHELIHARQFCETPGRCRDGDPLKIEGKSCGTYWHKDAETTCKDLVCLEAEAYTAMGSCCKDDGTIDWNCVGKKTGGGVCSIETCRDLFLNPETNTCEVPLDNSCKEKIEAKKYCEVKKKNNDGLDTGEGDGLPV